MVKAKHVIKAHASGKRKKAVARATITKNGSGIVKINNILLNNFSNTLARARIEEPILLAGSIAKKVDIKVNVEGGGVTGQADAIRLAISRALAQEDEKLKSVFLDYDRLLMVADVRRNEPAKPNCNGKPRSKRQKSYR